MRKTTIAIGGTLLPLALLFWACGEPRLPVPKYVQQQTSALIEVPYPPPPAHTEGIPPQPRKDAVWVDGEWNWDGRRWGWKQGRWLVPPRDAKFAPWATVWGHDGTLYFAPGVWKDARGRTLVEPEPLVGARTGNTPIVGPEGEPFPIGPTVRAIEDAGHD